MRPLGWKDVGITRCRRGRDHDPLGKIFSFGKMNSTLFDNVHLVGDIIWERSLAKKVRIEFGYFRSLRKDLSYTDNLGGFATIGIMDDARLMMIS